MESLSKQELISTITKQSDQVKRYETRLRDVVAAYKGLVKEKEALEISLKALNKTESRDKNDDSVAALTLSISTLTAEKARMEEAFQADKKFTRDKYENTIAAMREEMKTLSQQHQAEINNMKAKISYEIQERERERADHSAMMKELQMKLNSEIRSKADERPNSSSDSNVSTLELEKRVRDLSSELEAAQRRLMRAEARTSETPALLVRLQEKMALLEQTHSVAIREEQIKAKRAEETARKVCARQEERVAIFEAKLAELSQTIGEYDARRRSDQQTISHLKETLNAQLLDRFAAGNSGASFDEPKQKSETDNDKLADSEYLQTLIDKIHILKQELVSENQKLGSPIDVYAVLKLDGFENIHLKCQDEYEKLQSEFEAYKIQNVSSSIDGDDDVKDKLYVEIAELKMRVENQKDLVEGERLAKREAVESLEAKLKTEHTYHKEVVSDLKTRIQALEKQVQTQRDRYAALLEETDNYIRARNERARKISTDDSHVLPDVSAPPHMLHYAHELARKDLDISQLRKDKHNIEGQLRDCQREATIEKERFKEVVRTLKEEIERLRRIQSREGANLEYLKNVVMAYLMSTNYDGRRHMLNAIAAVLHFTRSEKNMVLKNL